MASSSGLGLTLIDEKDIALGEILGVGGFGAVYLARHVNWGKVAVKQLKGITLTAEVQKEADRMLRVIASPYIVRVMGLIKNPQEVSIVMEFFENGSLKEFEKKYMKCDCWARKVKMVQDIAFGMNYLHTLKPPIFHRDLKLENVFVGSGFEAKIGDLGLAVSSKSSLYKAGASGTISHMPPEAFNPSTATEPDEFWDIFTFAITSYELTSGSDAWPQLNTWNAPVDIWVCKGHRPNLEVIPKDAPSELVDIIKKCWVAEPKQRPSFKDILKSVTELFENKYERRLRKADRTISEQMDLVQEAAEAKGSAATDSGVSSGWGSLEVIKPVTSLEKRQDTIASSGSGLASVVEGGRAEASSPSKEHRVQQQGVREKLLQQPNRVQQQGVRRKLLQQPNRVQQQGDNSAADSGISSAFRGMTVDETDMTWQYMHDIDPDGGVYACDMISKDHIAICGRVWSSDQGCVWVYEVSSERSKLAYRITSKEWEGNYIMDVAVSVAIPNAMMIICEQLPYVYIYSCHESTKEINKFTIQSDVNDPWCIVANDSVAVIAMGSDNSYMVCRLPQFTQQSCIKIDFEPRDLSISSDYLLVMGYGKMVVRALCDVNQDVCRMEPPDGCRGFINVCFRDNGKQIYAACVKGNKGCVYKYTWDGAGTPHYINSGCVIDGLGWVGNKRLSVTSEGLLAVGQFLSDKVSIYKLQ